MKTNKLLKDQLRSRQCILLLTKGHVPKPTAVSTQSTVIRYGNIYIYIYIYIYMCVCVCVYVYIYICSNALLCCLVHPEVFVQVTLCSTVLGCQPVVSLWNIT